ncbi:MAG: SsrA-binding protein SmpB [Actinobacteria bacterium]|nr:SsrA-binding protein SmpB [Actinomycetota bacterium]MCI0677441.1 SsrA-binding protein SmpB [Actinomycetota bacterium]
MNGREGAVKVIASNRRARRDYQVLDTFEAGLVLLGSEVKSLRAGRLQLKDAYAQVERGEAYLVGAHIAPYQFSREGGHDPERSRKLLLRRREIDRISGLLAEKGLTLIPLQVYFKDGKAKVELGLARGKTGVDKREAIKERDHRREMETAAARRRRA